jgi:sulfate permease, SulP family
MTAANSARLAWRPQFPRFPFLGELRHYSRDDFRRDLIAAITLTLVSIPQSVGFSLILGLPPMSVITSVIVGGFVSAWFFSSRHHVFGPTTSVSLITATTIAANPDLGLHPLQLAAYLAFIIGIIQFIAGLCNFGEVTKFISRSVVVGYTTAIGVLLMASQLHNWAGFESPAGQSFLANLQDAVYAAISGGFSWWGIGIGCVTLLIFQLIQRYRPHWPEALIVLALLGVTARVFAWVHPDVPFLLVKDEGALSAALPALAHLPSLAAQWTILPRLINTAIAIAIIGMLEATAITKSLAAKSGQHLDPNQELLGMGAGNIAAGLFGVPPGSSSFTRSAVNYQCNAASQLASMLSSAVVLIILLFFTPIFNYIPLAALAAHLIRVGYKLIQRSQIRIATRATGSDAVVFFVTLGTALFLKLDTAIYVGIGVALALFLQKSSTPHLAEYTFNSGGHLTELRNPADRLNPQITIIHVEGALYFGAADLFQNQMRQMAEDKNIRIFILRMRSARHLDASTVMALDSFHDYLHKTGRYLFISGCNRDVVRVLRNSGLLAHIGEENIFPIEENPTVSTRRALQRARTLLAAKPDIRLFYDQPQPENAPNPASAISYDI